MTARKNRDISIEAFRKEVESLCVKLRWAFYMNGYIMHLDWRDQEYKTLDNDLVIAAEIKLDQSYLEFGIKIYRTTYDKWCEDPSKMHAIIVHEFCHLVIDPLYLVAAPHLNYRLSALHNQAREAAVERMARMLMESQKLGGVSDALAKVEQVEKPTNVVRRAKPSPARS